MATETKRERFERIAYARTDKILEMMRLLGNCSAKTNYTYKDEEIEDILKTLETELKILKNRFNLQTADSLKDNFRDIFESEYTWLAGFMRNVYRFADKEALFDPRLDRSWTYRTLNAEANKFSNALLEHGLKKGDVIMFQLLNCPEFVFAYLTAHKTGGVASPVNFRLSPGEIAFSLEDSRPKVYMYESSMQDVIEKALSMSKFRPDIMIMVDSDLTKKAPSGFVSYTDFTANHSQDNPVLPYALNIYDETTRFYTSGTTGMPKGVPQTSINEVLSAHDVLMHFPLSSKDKTMNTTPWFHRGGLHSGGVNPTLYAGGTVVIMRKFDAKICLEYTEKYKLTFLIGVPTVLSSLTEEQEREGRDLSSLNGIVTMGSPLERAACISYQKTLTPNIFNGYGTTETFWNTFLRPYDLPDMSGTAGRSCTDDEVRVVRSYDDRRAEPDDEVARDSTEVGEVIIKSPAKSAYCYYNNQAETERKFYKGFLYTNDLGVWDKNQFVTIVGRKDDMIISGGENIYPTLIEEILNENKKVKDCIVTAVPDKHYGELVTAYIVRSDKTLNVGELDDYCRNHPMISPYKRPRYYRFVEEIPLNATGKKLHYKIKEIAKMDLINGLLVRA